MNVVAKINVTHRDAQGLELCGQPTPLPRHLRSTVPKGHGGGSGAPGAPVKAGIYCAGLHSSKGRYILFKK